MHHDKLMEILGKVYGNHIDWKPAQLARVRKLVGLIEDHMEREYSDMLLIAHMDGFEKGKDFEREQKEKREWVDLTEEEINEVFGADIRDEQSGELRFIRAIEAKLKEKNHGSN